MCYFTVAKKTKQNGFHVSCLCTLLIVWTLTYAIGIVKTRTYRLVPSIHWCKYLVLYVCIYTVSIIFCVQSAFVAFTITKQFTVEEIFSSYLIYFQEVYIILESLLSIFCHTQLITCTVAKEQILKGYGSRDQDKEEEA